MTTNSFSSRLITGSGISMGDEGKGRLMYEVIEDLKVLTGDEAPVAMILKVNGGANSGHTAAGLKHNLLPSGITEASIAHLGVGMGVVADPRKFLWEAVPLEDRDFIVLDRLLIDERTMVSDLTHRLLDLAWEDYRVHVLEEPPRGSTGRGITPAYSDEVNQQQVFYHEFLGEKDAFARKLQLRVDRAMDTIREVCRVAPERWDGFFETLTRAETLANKESVDAGIFYEDEFDFGQFKGPELFTLDVDQLLEVYWTAGQKLATCIGNVPEKVLEILGDDRHVIGEFGQSYWLDKRRGFTPNVTASHTFTPELFQSAGIPVQPVHNIGVCKAYDTKVGTHIFLTRMEEEHPLSPILKELEFGTSTGRQRMVGWFDAVEKGEALRYGGFQDLVINKLDALTHSGEWTGNLKICVAYRDASGNLVQGVPRNENLRRELEPVYLETPGWSRDISDVRAFRDLPEEAQSYIALMVRSTLEAAHPEGLPEMLPQLRFIGVGPMPGQIIRDLPSTADLIQAVSL